MRDRGSGALFLFVEGVDGKRLADVVEKVVDVVGTELGGEGVGKLLAGQQPISEEFVSIPDAGGLDAEKPAGVLKDAAAQALLGGGLPDFGGGAWAVFEEGGEEVGGAVPGPGQE